MTANQRSAVSSQASAALTSDSSGRDSTPLGRLKSTRSTGLCLLTDFHLPDDMRTSVISAQRARTRWMSSPEDFPVRTSRTRVFPAKPDGSGSTGNEADSSTKRCVSSPKYGPGGWCLRTSRHSSFPTKGGTWPASSRRFENSGMWDSGGLLTLNISEAPAVVAASSWSPVLESNPQWSCWLMPDQWKQYLARLLRSRSFMKRTHGLGILFKPQTTAPGSLLAVSFSWLSKTDGIRWLIGSESLAAMGFASDWMRPALRKSGVPETPSIRVSQNGSRES